MGVSSGFVGLGPGVGSGVGTQVAVGSKRGVGEGETSASAVGGATRGPVGRGVGSDVCPGLGIGVTQAKEEKRKAARTSAARPVKKLGDAACPLGRVKKGLTVPSFTGPSGAWTKGTMCDVPPAVQPLTRPTRRLRSGEPGSGL